MHTYGSKYHLCADIGEGSGNPLQYSCLENPVDRGAWWAAIDEVAQSWTRLKRLSNSSSADIFNVSYEKIKQYRKEQRRKRKSTHTKMPHSKSVINIRWTLFQASTNA